MHPPDMRPIMVKKLSLYYPRAIEPTIINGRSVIIKPHITHHMPVVLNTVAAKPCPEDIPTDAKKRHMPNSRIRSDDDDEV